MKLNLRFQPYLAVYATWYGFYNQVYNKLSLSQLMARAVAQGRPTVVVRAGGSPRSPNQRGFGTAVEKDTVTGLQLERCRSLYAVTVR